MPDVVDQLLAVPGLYLGTQVTPHAPGENVGVARILVTPLPGGAGVAMDYEVASPANGLVHHEHAVLARGMEGVLFMTAHSHAAVATVVRETEPGYFLAAEGDAPFPMAVRLEVPEPGHLIYSWSYGRPGEELRVADVGDVRAVSSAG